LRKGRRTGGAVHHAAQRNFRRRVVVTEHDATKSSLPSPPSPLSPLSLVVAPLSLVVASPSRLLPLRLRARAA
jgi:hypothetical protein